MEYANVMTPDEEAKALANGFKPEMVASIKEKRLKDSQPAGCSRLMAAAPTAPETPTPGPGTPDAAEMERVKLQKIWHTLQKDVNRRKMLFPDLSDRRIYNMHHTLLHEVANKITLAPQLRKFVEDNYNSTLIKFLLYYFNNCPLAESLYPEKRFKLAKPLLLMGNVGVGKTLIMQLFAEYLKRINSPNRFYNVSVTQMVNYYTIHNNLDRYTYNEEINSGMFEGSPVNLCLNDIGVDADEKKRQHFGTDLKTLTEEFLHARNEIWTLTGKKAHLTTNLEKPELDALFKDKFGGRIPDRFKTYNLIILKGTSRR